MGPIDDHLPTVDPSIQQRGQLRVVKLTSRMETLIQVGWLPGKDCMRAVQCGAVQDGWMCGLMACPVRVLACWNRRQNAHTCSAMSRERGNERLGGELVMAILHSQLNLEVREIRLSWRRGSGALHCVSHSMAR